MVLDQREKQARQLRVHRDAAPAEYRFSRLLALNSTSSSASRRPAPARRPSASSKSPPTTRPARPGKKTCLNLSGARRPVTASSRIGELTIVPFLDHPLHGTARREAAARRVGRRCPSDGGWMRPVAVAGEDSAAAWEGGLAAAESGAPVMSGPEAARGAGTFGHVGGGPPASVSLSGTPPPAAAPAETPDQAYDSVDALARALQAQRKPIFPPATARPRLQAFRLRSHLEPWRPTPGRPDIRYSRHALLHLFAAGPYPQSSDLIITGPLGSRPVDA